MPEINAAAGALTTPIWAVGAVAAVFLVLIMLAIAQAGTLTVLNALSRAAIVIAVASAGWVYVQQMERQEEAVARRALDERSAALLARAVAPGSALSCLNEVAGETVEAACEKAVFASPEAVSAAVSYVTAELALLADGSSHARRVADHAYALEFAPLRAALEQDRFGIVSHVLARRGCTTDGCDALDLFNDPNRLLANLRDHVFDDQVTKFAASWNGASRPAADAAAAVPLRPAAMVSPQYDFPSSDSIPPVNIMAPEPGPRSGTAANQVPPPAGNSRTSAAPVPPRRPQGRTPVASARPPAHRPAAPAPPAAPVAVGDTPTDGAAPSAQQ
jgi:hypothetical protein